jgi:hypothetical protein
MGGLPRRQGHDGEPAQASRGLVLVNPSLAPDTKLFLLAPVLTHVIRSMPGTGSGIKKPGEYELGPASMPVLLNALRKVR